MPVTTKNNSGFDPSKYGAVEVPVKEVDADFDPTKYGATEVKKKNSLSVGSDGQLKESVPTTSSSEAQSVSQPVPDFGMASFNDLAKGQKNASENTTAVAPKEFEQATNPEIYSPEILKQRAKDKEERISKALDNTTAKALKLKGISAQQGSAQFNEQKSKFALSLANGDAHVALDKNGVPGLKRTTGAIENLTKGFNEATANNDENAAFYDMSPEQRVEFVNKKISEEKPNEYIGETPSLIGSAGHLAGSSAPFLGKAAAGAAIGTATGGAGAPAAFAFLLTTPDMINSGVKDEVIRRYQILKSQYPQRSDVENMTEAGKGALAGGVGGILTNAAMMTGMKAPLSAEGKSLLNTTLKGIAKPALQMGGISGGVTAATELEGNLEGIKSDPKDIIKHSLESFKDNATTGFLLTTMFHAPNILKSVSKYILAKEANPEAIKSVVQANENIGQVPPGTTEKVMNDLDQFKTIVNTLPDGLKPEVEASVAGLLQKRENINSEAETKSKSPAIQQLYKDKVEAIDRQIADIQRTGKPMEHEIDEATGETYKKPAFDNIAAMRIKNLADKISKGKEITDPEELQTEHNFPEELEKGLRKIEREENAANREKENPNTDLSDNINSYLEKNAKETEKTKVEIPIATEKATVTNESVNPVEQPTAKTEITERTPEEIKTITREHLPVDKIAEKVDMPDYYNKTEKVKAFEARTEYRNMLKNIEKIIKCI